MVIYGTVGFRFAPKPVIGYITPSTGSLQYLYHLPRIFLEKSDFFQHQEHKTRVNRTSRFWHKFNTLGLGQVTPFCKLPSTIQKIFEWVNEYPPPYQSLRYHSSQKW
jgi:hypothetical protein